MEENAKKAIFIGVAIFIAIIILSIVAISMSAANSTEKIAKEYKGQGIKRDASAQSLLGRDKISGDEVIYLLQASKKEKEYSICIYGQPDFPSEYTNTNINNSTEWVKDYDKNLTKYIKSEYNYSVNIEYGGITKISLFFI